MKKKYITSIVLEALIIVFLAVNIVAALISQDVSLFSYVCCHIVCILQALTLISAMRWENSKEDE